MKEAILHSGNGLRFHRVKAEEMCGVGEDPEEVDGGQLKASVS